MMYEEEKDFKECVAVFEMSSTHFCVLMMTDDRTFSNICWEVLTNTVSTLGCWKPTRLTTCSGSKQGQRLNQYYKIILSYKIPNKIWIQILKQ